MLTKQTILTQTGSGTDRPVLYFQGNKPTGEPLCGDLHAVKQRSAGTAEEAEDQKISGNNPIRVQKVTTGKR